MKYLSLVILFLLPNLLFACQKDNPETTGLDEPADKVFKIKTQADFDKWSNYKFPEGSKVLFAAGQTFTGQFKLRGSGSEASPNLATAYNPDTGEIFSGWIENKPSIRGDGKVSSALKLIDGDNWEINNIEVSNTDGSKSEQGKLLGINVVATNTGTMKNISIRNCYVHHVNGEVGGKETGGIHVYVLGESTPTRFDGLLIENNVISHVGGVGIANQSGWGSIGTETYYPWKNVVFRGNRVEYTGRNGIIIRYAENARVEYNKLAFNSRFDTGHSVFNFNTVGCVVQYNEAWGNTSDNPDDIDHGGFDADWNAQGTIIQYNYSHDNNWFCGIMRKLNTDVTIRYNISQNERLGAILYGFPTATGLKDVKIYNNTFYFGKGQGNRIFVAAGKTRIPIETVFSNNIFYFEDEAQWGFEPDESCSFTNNLFYGVSEKGDNAISADPLFENPGSGGTDIDMHDPKRLNGYRLKTGSPAIDAGHPVQNSGGKDFLGNTINGKPDLGAMEKQ